jgi:Phospholipase_D-nuclease N-terminal
VRHARDDQRVSLFWTLIAILVAIIWVITLIDLFRRHLGAGPTIGWVLLVIVLPFIGAIIYWIVRKPSADEVEHYVEAEHEFRGKDPRGRSAPPPPP